LKEHITNLEALLKEHITNLEALLKEHITNFMVKEARGRGDRQNPSGLETSAIGMQSP